MIIFFAQSEQMREDIRDYQRQVEAQRESMLAKRDEDFEVQDKISGKNKLINMALEENRVSLYHLQMDIMQKGFYFVYRIWLKLMLNWRKKLRK
jgi:hypothetical protein